MIGIAKMKEGFESQLKELNVTLQECKTFESDVMSHLQNCPKEGVITRIDSLELNNKFLDDLTPQKYQRDETLLLAEWEAEFERLVEMKKHFYKELDVKLYVDSNNEHEIQSAFDAKIKLLGVLNTLQTKVLEELKPCQATEILSKIERLVTFNKKVVEAIPLHFKNNHTIDEAFNLWSTAYAGLAQLKNHVKDTLHFKSNDDDNDIQARFDEWIKYLKDIQKAFGVETSCACVKEIHEFKSILSEINAIKTVLGTIPMIDCSQTLQLQDRENERLLASIKTYEDEAKKTLAKVGDGGDKMLAELNVLKAEKLTQEGQLRTARQQCEIQGKEIETLKASKIVLQDKTIEDQDRIEKLEEHIKTLGSGGGTKTLDLNDRVSKLLDQLRMLMHDDGSAELASRIAAMILDAFPGTMHETFIKRIFLQLYHAIHPRISTANIDELLKDMAHLEHEHDGWV
jgi:bacterioferritin-associated ferredoxin